MPELEKPKKYDLEERTFLYARRVRRLVKSPQSHEIEADDKKQLIRSSGSVTANYMEANEAVSKKDFALRIKICRKEARESNMWLRLIRDEVKESFHHEIDDLISESVQLVKIFNSIAVKVKDA